MRKLSKVVVRSFLASLLAATPSVVLLAQDTAKPASASSAVNLPKAEVVIEKYIAALGGREKLAAVKTQSVEGTMSIPAAGLNGKIEIYQETNGKFKMQASVPGVVSQESGSDGTTMWEFSNVTGAEILSGSRAEQMKLQMQPFPSLTMLKNYDSIECTGMKEYAGENCYVLVLKKKGLPSTTTYYSVATGLEKGGEATSVSAMGEVKVQSEVKQYATVDGIKYASEVESTFPNGMKQTITVDKVTFNDKIDPSKFDMPEEVKSLLKN